MVFDPLLPIRDGSRVSEPISGHEEDREGRELLRRIERTNLMVVILMVCGSLLLAHYPITLGIASGGALMALNFRVLRRIVEGWVLHDKKTALIKYGVKFFALLGCVAGILVFFRRWVEPLGLLIGASGLFWALWIQGLRKLRRQ